MRDALKQKNFQRSQGLVSPCSVGGFLAWLLVHPHRLRGVALNLIVVARK
jgi:hypothetical protein